jgi:hypothetical protein
MLLALADSSKVPTFFILNCITVPKEQLPRGIFVRCKPKGWMVSEFRKYWLADVWNRTPEVLLRKWVFDTFNGI